MSKKTVIYTNVEIGKSLGLSRINNRPIRLVNEDELSTLNHDEFEILEDYKLDDEGFEIERGEEIERKEKEKLQQLLDNFYELCNFCDELDIYENENLDNSMQEMKTWVDKNFGRKVK